MKETAVSLVPKEEAEYFNMKDDKDFINFITDKLTEEISRRIMIALEASGEIVLKKPQLKVSEYPTEHSGEYVEYRKTVEWNPLVRCRNCKSWDVGICTKMNRATNPYQFCDFGEKVEDWHTMLADGSYGSMKGDSNDCI